MNKIEGRKGESSDKLSHGIKYGFIQWVKISMSKKEHRHNIVVLR